MPGAARDRGRRRAASGNSGRGAPTAEYRFIECRDGVRIEHPQHATVDLRVDRRHIAIRSARRSTRCSLFTTPVGLARLVAGVLLDLPDDASREAFGAIRGEIFAIGRMLEVVRRRLLDRHAADFSAVEQRMLQLRGSMPRLARSPQFYRTPYLLSDVCRFRAAAIALAFLEDELWPPALAVDGQAIGIPQLYRVMRSWRGLFAPDGVAYRSLDRTLMNLPDGIYPALVCTLRHVRLERPITDPLELHLLLECVALAKQRGQQLPWLHALQHARAAAIRAGLERIAAATHRAALDPQKPSDLRFVATYLLDAQGGAADRFEHVVGHAVRRHAELRRRRPVNDHLADALARARSSSRPAFAADTPTAVPPLPPPDVAGLRFLATVGEVIEEGQRMRHCVAIYAERATRGDCFLFHAEHAGAAASLEVGAEGVVRQATGPGNRHNAACDWGRRELARWVARWPPHERPPVDTDGWGLFNADLYRLELEMLGDTARRARALVDRLLQPPPEGTLH